VAVANLQRDRDGNAIPRRLRNIIFLLHHLPDPRDATHGSNAHDTEWLMAVSLAEAQSLVILLRGADSVLGTEALALLQVENSAMIAATTVYRERLGTDSPGLNSGIQMMRFLNNSRKFSPAQVRLGRLIQHVVSHCCVA
jgi:hypothetical protein